MGWRDEWPSTAGVCYDGKRLLQLLHEGRNPFSGQWDPQQLIEEVEEHIGVHITDVPFITKGSNNFGIPLKTSNGRELVARLGRSDVNMPDFDGFPIEAQVQEVRFEAATYELLRSESAIRASRLLYHRIPVQHPGPKLELPTDLSGRRLLVFEKDEGSINNLLLDQLASVRAALFNFLVPSDFARLHLHDRLFEFKPETLSIPPDPTRSFWMHVLQTKIEATIREQGDMIGWESDNETVGPVALAAKNSLLRAVPIITPEETAAVSLYRFVLEHGDYGIHNKSTRTDSDGHPHVTSLFDWETGCIAPALLTDPLAATGPVDLIVDDTANPSVCRIPDDSKHDDLQLYQSWAQHYIEKLYIEAPDMKDAIRAGRDLRHLWFSLRDWRGGNSEKFFGELGAWAEERIRERQV